MRSCFPRLRLLLYGLGEKKLPEFSHQPHRFGSHTTATAQTDKGGRSEADFYKDADRSNVSGQEY